MLRNSQMCGVALFLLLKTVLKCSHFAVKNMEFSQYYESS